MGSVERRAFWAEHITAWRGSGMSQARYCEQQGLSLASFGYWRRRLSDPAAGATVSFVAAGFDARAAAVPVPMLHGPGWQLALPADVSPGWLADLLKGLR